MEQWELDIHEHRKGVAYYLGDFIQFTEAESAREWIDLDGHTPTLYRLAQFCVAHDGDPDGAYIVARFGSSLNQVIRNTSRIDLMQMSRRLHARSEVHDLSKLFPPERETFEVFTPKLKTLTYGSDEYRQALVDMGPGLQHHYAVNSHHPEHYPGGIFDMNLLDVIEMFCDWLAACDAKRVQLDIAKQIQRFGGGERMEQVLTDTRDWLRQWHREDNCPSYF